MEGCEPQRQTERMGICSKEGAADPSANAYFKKFYNPQYQPRDQYTHSELILTLGGEEKKGKEKERSGEVAT